MQAMLRKTTSSDTLIGARATLYAGIDRIYSGIPKGRGWASYPFNTLTLDSQFQPIFSVAEKRCVAYEGLMRACNLTGHSMKPETVFALSANHQEELFLDWLCRALHMRNFNNLAAKGDMIFLNAYPEAAIEDPHHPQVFARMMEFYSIHPKNVVIEILETGVSDEAQLVDAVKLYRKLGCKIAIDDFGVGYSNFDRLWRLRPDFVKIDRSVTATAARETHAKLVLTNMVKLIQQCGAKVIVEGIETRDEALTALEVGADFLQGYFFARPGMAPVPQALCDNMFAGLMDDYLPVQIKRTETNLIDPDTLDNYKRALNVAILDLQRGYTFAQATEAFLALPQVQRICLASGDARHLTAAVEGAGGSRVVLDMIEKSPAAPNRANDATGTSIDRLQHVLQHALSAPHQVHITDDVATFVPDATQSPIAITLSCAFELDQRMVVLCGDVVDRRRRAPSMANNGEQRRAANDMRHLHL